VNGTNGHQHPRHNSPDILPHSHGCENGFVVVCDAAVSTIYRISVGGKTLNLSFHLEIAISGRVAVLGDATWMASTALNATRRSSVISRQEQLEETLRYLTEALENVRNAPGGFQSDAARRLADQVQQASNELHDVVSEADHEQKSRTALRASVDQMDEQALQFAQTVGAVVQPSMDQMLTLLQQQYRLVEARIGQHDEITANLPPKSSPLYTPALLRKRKRGFDVLEGLARTLEELRSQVLAAQTQVSTYLQQDPIVDDTHNDGDAGPAGDA